MFEWVVQFTTETRSGEKKAMKLRTEFLVVTAGPLTNPKLPRIPGVSKFKGTRFHTARWEYRTNGRSPEDATFDKLRHKRVGSANAGRVVDAITESGLVCNDKEYPIDILIYGTGFEPWTAGGPSLRASMQIYGRGGQEIETKWSTKLAMLYIKMPN
ncbi:hypothetical protein FOTG_08800 [Fusarium oxysporum f. sp. vasinfectum 25433]|uniref:FAD/NAD(P)-binding domain-containing protein n=1 Tax=Fusarium oxysporum f. sp. vasinfectum 25433 TaxID=1089449 RepID=X0MU03_FUSOX|nr:hypothetical protein FOTG_08800 [Fusarium oxysporum f. sp. vasinfectum 25433]